MSRILAEVTLRLVPQLGQSCLQQWYDSYHQHWSGENRMIRSIAVLLVVSASLFAAELGDAGREVAVGWTKAAVKQDEAALQRLLADDLTYAHANVRTQNK